MIKYEHLCGKPFDLQNQNCYHLLRALYKDNWGIELTDYPCPVDYCEARLNLYATIAESEGFTPVFCHPRDYRPGDVALIAIDAPYGNHVAVFLESGDIVHHLVGQLSRTTKWGGVFRNCTLGVYRHKDVPDTRATAEKVDFRDLLPEPIRRRFDLAQAARAAAEAENTQSAP